MQRYTKAALALLGLLVLGWGAVKLVYEPFMTRQLIALMAEESRKIEAFNAVGRLETYDSLSTLLQKGCLREAAQLIEIQQSLLLTGIAHDMEQSPEVSKVVSGRNAQVAERARAEATNRNPPRGYTPCR
ncbi:MULTISPECIES: hypothetical protein [unclassified Polaromonas]|uniref:hypothetical protein n=1 Tax=unclassified Polaromonas TaxID=2638319 RepID=UPI000F091549|nr:MULTISPECIES: hypothetical protein [unclassified Polaromonas]AYQ28775.1 hypothetical protein DT070_12500 [Polaromonas sp. SP1]QGJ20110.1 hypothetical protein F7R28_18100 [Polaromonas sp. Pch-P]